VKAFEHTSALVNESRWPFLRMPPFGSSVDGDAASTESVNSTSAAADRQTVMKLNSFDPRDSEESAAFSDFRRPVVYQPAAIFHSCC
jgi:hypothetical protein